MRSIGGFNSSGYGSFSEGGELSARGLNRMAAGIDKAQTMFSQGIDFQTSNGGVAYNTPSYTVAEITSQQNPIIQEEKVDHYEMKVLSILLGELTVPVPILKIARGGNVWRPKDSECTTCQMSYDILSDGTIPIIPGTNPESPWASSDGYIVMVPEVLYWVYNFKLETAAGSFLYIYISTSPGLIGTCPVPLPAGIPEPGIPYNIQGVVIGSATYTLPFTPVINQGILGSVTWPNLPSVPTTEYVNQYEAKVVDIDIEGTSTAVLKIGRGGNIWNPSIDSSKNALEKLVNDITPGPDIFGLVTGSDANSPWASNDGYVILEPASVYVYAFKVTYDNGATTDFYIYVSESSTLVNPVDGEIPLPSGISMPAGNYTVQGVRVADVIADFSSGSAVWNITQRVVGTITWPDYVPPYKPQQFEVVVKQDNDLYKMQIAKGEILWSFSALSLSLGGIHRPLQGQAVKMWVYPTGSLYPGFEESAAWLNEGGAIALDTTKVYGVYIIGNQDALGVSSQGAVSIAVIEDGSDADIKSNPYNSYMGRGWFTLVTVGTIGMYGDVFGPPTYAYLRNYNSQKYKIAKVYWNETKWVVEQRLFGPVTLNNDLYFDSFGSIPGGYPPWEPEGLDHFNDWCGTWAGYTKDGSPDDCTIKITY